MIIWRISGWFFSVIRYLYPVWSNIAMENQPIWWYLPGNGYCSLPNKSVSCRSAFCWTGRGPKLLVSFLGELTAVCGVDPWLLAVKKQGMNSPNINGSFPWKKILPFQKESGSSSKPIIFSGTIFFVFFWGFLRIANNSPGNTPGYRNSNHQQTLPNVSDRRTCCWSRWSWQGWKKNPRISRIVHLEEKLNGTLPTDP